MKKVIQKNITAKNIAGRDLNQIRNKIINNYSIQINYPESYKQFKSLLAHKSPTLIAEIILPIDYKVIKSVRCLDIDKVLPSIVNDTYDKILYDETDSSGIELLQVLEMLNNDEFIFNASFDYDVELTIDDNLHEIRFKTYLGLEATLLEPKLLWECNCAFNQRDSLHDCPIHKNFKTYEEAELFSKCFRNGLVKIAFNNVQILWKDLKDLWPPSIDSLNLIKDIESLDYHKRKFTSIHDLGSGTGFLGIWLAKNNQSIKNVHFSDWLLLPLIYSYINCTINNINCSKEFLLGLNTTWIRPRNEFFKYDLLICNPPYLPDLGFIELRSESTVAGTDLLVNIIKNYRNISNEVIISFSNIALPEAKKAAKRVGLNLETLSLKKPHIVPFRVPIAFRTPGYIEKLKMERDLILKPDSAFPYWHEINTYILK